MFRLSGRVFDKVGDANINEPSSRIFFNFIWTRERRIPCSVRAGKVVMAGYSDGDQIRSNR